MYLRKSSVFRTYTCMLAARCLSSSACSNSQWPTKCVEITCANLYENWSKLSSQRAPVDGLQLKIDYLDTKQTHPQTADNAPVVIMVHGAPGSCNDFSPLIHNLVGKGARVVAPNLPDYSLTIETNGMFKHSADEKAEILKDFLSAISVNKVDMLLTHSSGCYPGLLLHELMPFRAIAMMSPMGHRRIKSMRPAWFLDRAVRMYQNPMGRAVYRNLAPLIFKIVSSPVRIDNMDDAVLSATTMHYSGNHRLAAQLASLQTQQTPLLLVFSENDGLIESKIFYEQAEMLGAKKEHFSRFDKNGKLVHKSQLNDWLNVVAFEAGGHYCFLKYADVVSTVIEDLMKTAKL